MKFFIGFITFAAMSFASAQEYNYQLAAPSPYGSAPSYSAPAAPSYSAPSYAPAPSYKPAPSYAARPSYAPVHAGPATSYTYPSPSPPVPCPTNLLLSCAPSVAPVPCQSVSYAPSKPSYSAPSYSAPAAPSYSAPASPSYRWTTWRFPNTPKTYSTGKLIMILVYSFKFQKLQKVKIKKSYFANLKYLSEFSTFKLSDFLQRTLRISNSWSKRI